MIDATSVYDFEGLIQTAVETVFTSLGFASILTPDSEITLQKERPVLLVVFKDNGAITSGQQGASIPDPLYGESSGLTRAAAYNGTLELTIASNSTDTEAATFRQWKSAIRWYAEQLPIRLTTPTPLLQSISIRKIEPRGASINYKNEQGYWTCSLNFDVRFALIGSALNQPQFNSTN